MKNPIQQAAETVKLTIMGASFQSNAALPACCNAKTKSIEAARRRKPPK
jgi:hypothetical protein